MIKTENRPLSDSGNDFNRDIELVARICNSDQKALELLYSSYYSRLSRFIARVITREDLIDEVINDVMYVVWEKAKSYNHQCKPSTWIFGIAYNRARQALRDANRNNEESLENLIDNGVSFEDDKSILKQLEMSDWLLPALGKLTPDQRAVIELTYFQGLAYSEIAEVMACPENTVKTRMHHARKKLATLLTSTD
ncbi:MAG: RNA polymerase sigma factor [Methylococcales bacterium]|nr:RNA polymerase sigma factor [Methylococcales bacterium]